MYVIRAFSLVSLFTYSNVLQFNVIFYPFLLGKNIFFRQCNFLQNKKKVTKIEILILIQMLNIYIYRLKELQYMYIYIYVCVCMYRLKELKNGNKMDNKKIIVSRNNKHMETFTFQLLYEYYQKSKYTPITLQ